MGNFKCLSSFHKQRQQMAYLNKNEWNSARLDDWESKRPARQKLTKTLCTKGSKLYSVYVGTDDYDRMKAEIWTWSVTSLRRFKKVSYLGESKRVRDVKLYIAKDGSDGYIKEQLTCFGDLDEEVLDDDYFSTPQKALQYIKKENLHYLKWLKVKPPSTPETEALDRMFSVERLERKRIAIGRLEKRLLNASVISIDKRE